MPWTPLVKLRCSNPHQGSCTHQHHQLEMQARRGGRSEGPAGRKEKNRMRLREGLPMDQRHAKLSSAAVFVRKLHDLAVQKRGYVDLLGAADADNAPCYYGHTLPKDSSCTMPSSWSMTDPTTFLIRGESYLLDRQKIKAENTLMQMVGADWIKSDKREDDLAGRPWGTSPEICSTRRQQIFLHCKYTVGTTPPTRRRRRRPQAEQGNVEHGLRRAIGE